jgi:hypothetical protein
MYESDYGQVPSCLPRVYSGLVVDAWMVKQTVVQGGEGAAQGGLFAFLDIPLSLAADTLVLPFTIYQQIRFGNFRPRLVPEVHEASARARQLREESQLRYCRGAINKPGVTEAARATCRRELEEHEAADGGGSVVPQ